MAAFIDKARIHVFAGKGGDGATSFRREKYVEFGGPDGGNGGAGGSVWLEADPHLTTLLDVTLRTHVRAEPGEKGLGANKTGRTGEDSIVKVPVGTLVYVDEKLKADLKAPGERFLAAKGGRGGRGNLSFKTSRNTTPRLAEKGEPGQTVTVDLELKLLADVGLAGFPNAGKSTLLARLSAARPKIADYAFTTLSPNLGVVQAPGRSFVLADIPGLIEGAHEGKGLGDEFLRHIERTRVVIHVVDVFGFEGRSAYDNFKAINKELALYSEMLANKPQVVVANKMDLTGGDDALKAFKKKLRGVKVHAVSGATGDGLPAMLKAVASALAKAPEPPPFVDEGVADYYIPPQFEIEKEGELFHVTGAKVDRLIAMTNFDQDEAVGRLQRILRKMGVEDELLRRGVKSGDAVQIGDYGFTFKPDPGTKA